MSEGTIRIIDRKPPPFPIWKSTVEVYRGVFMNFFGLLRAAWLPLLAFVLLSSLEDLAWLWWLKPQLFAVTTAMGDDRSLEMLKSAAFQFLGVSYLFRLLLFVPLAYCAIAFHRFVLLGERKHGWKNSGVEYGAREVQFAISSVKVLALTWLPYVVVLWLIVAVGDRNFLASQNVIYMKAILGTLLAGVVMRVSFVLPHTALGHRSDLGLVWRQSIGHTWRLALFSISIYLPFALFSFLRPLIPIWLREQENAADLLPWFVAASYLVSMLKSVLFLMVTITALSIAYREIIGLPDSDDAADEEASVTPTAPLPA